MSYYVMIGHQLLSPFFKKLGKPAVQYFYSGHPFLEQLRILSWNMSHSSGFYVPIKLGGPVTMLTEHEYLFYCNCKLIAGRNNGRIEIDVSKDNILHNMFETEEGCCNDCDWTNDGPKHERNSCNLSIDAANKLTEHLDTIFWAVRMSLDPPSYMPHHPKYERARIPTLLWV